MADCWRAYAQELRGERGKPWSELKAELGIADPTPDSGAAKSGGEECVHEWRLGTTMFEYCESCDARKPYPPAPEVQE